MGVEKGGQSWDGCSDVISKCWVEFLQIGEEVVKVNDAFQLLQDPGFEETAVVLSFFFGYGFRDATATKSSVV